MSDYEELRYYQDLKNNIEEITEFKLIKEVNEIAELGGFQVTEYSASYIIGFYKNVDSERFKHFKKAPPLLQKKYLRALEENYCMDTLDDLIKLNEILDYSIQDMPEYNLTEDGILKNDNRNAELFAINGYCYSFFDKQILLEHGERYSNDYMKQLDFNIKESFYGNQVKPVLATAIYLLNHKFGKEVMVGILERFYNDNIIGLDIQTLYYLASNWSVLENYPLSWSLETTR